MFIALFILTIAHGQYDSYYDADGDLIPIEDLVPTQLVTTFEPPPQEPSQENADGESKFDFWDIKNVFQIVKYGTLTCANGLIKLDIYQKDVMLIVMTCILILQGKKFKSHEIHVI